MEKENNDNKENTIKDEVKLLREEILNLTEPKKKVKDFKIPRRAKITKGQDRKNYVTVMYIKENGDVNFIKEPISEQTVVIDKCPRIATSDVVLRYKSKPLIIQPSWSVKPFSPVDNYNQTERDRLNSKGYRLLMNRMQTEAIKMKTNMNMLFIIGGLVLVGVIVYALFFGK